MDRVPTELLHEIFIKLDLKDRLKCMSVCRSWFDSLDKRCLLHRLFIRINRFPELQAMLKRHPHRANQVEYLSLDSYISDNLDKRTLFNMFPNLRQVTMYLYCDRREKTNYLDTSFEFTHPISKLDKIRDAYECELTCQLAMSNLCNNLKSLRLEYVSQYNHIFAQLKNMPVLESLILYDARVRLMDLEMMHHNLPSIKSLDLLNINVLSGEIPYDVIPATLVTQLDMYFKNVEDLSTHIQFYKYLVKKYPSVSEYIRVDNMISRGNTHYARELYNEGILPWYQTFGSHVDTFYFHNYCDGLDAFRKFDECGFKLNELSLETSTLPYPLFMEELVQSQQSKYIEYLTLIGIVPEPVEMLTNMEALACLEIKFDYSYSLYGDRAKPTINFSLLVEACPATLIQLSIQGVILAFNKPTSNLTSIQYLKLKNVNITGETTITGTSFPKLCELYLSCTITSHLTVSLPYQHLKEAKLFIQCPEYKLAVLAINTRSDGKPQRMLIWPAGEDACKGRLYYPDKPTSQSLEKELVDFICASVDQLTYSINPHEDSDDDDEY